MSGLAALIRKNRQRKRRVHTSRPPCSTACLPACLPACLLPPPLHTQSLSDPANVAPFARWFVNRMPIMSMLILKMAMTLAILLNLLGSLWWFIADIEGPDADSWIKNVMNSECGQRWRRGTARERPA